MGHEAGVPPRASWLLESNTSETVLKAKPAMDRTEEKATDMLKLVILELQRESKPRSESGRHYIGHAGVSDGFLAISLSVMVFPFHGTHQAIG